MSSIIGATPGNTPKGRREPLSVLVPTDAPTVVYSDAACALDCAKRNEMRPKTRGFVSLNYPKPLLLMTANSVVEQCRAMASKRNVHVTLSQDMLREIDRSAAEANRTRSQEIEHQYMAGRRRLAELERLAAQTLAQASPAPGTAAAAHLAQHRRLSGFGPSNEDSDDV